MDVISQQTALAAETSEIFLIPLPDSPHINALKASAIVRESNTAGQSSLKVSHSIEYAEQFECGYRNMPIGKVPLHPVCEDYSLSTELEHHKLFILADGHGGSAASRFFVHRASELISDLLANPPKELLAPKFDFGDSHHRMIFKNHIDHLYCQMDAEYCARKVQEYRTWLDVGSPAGLRPPDDGCTLIVNIVTDGWIVNCNVGDSRTIIAERTEDTESAPALNFWQEPPPQSFPEYSPLAEPLCESPSPELTAASPETSPEFDSASPQNSIQFEILSNSGISALNLPESTSSFHLIFSSSDHNMLHPEKIHSIHASGGQFVTPTGILKQLTITSPETRSFLPYHDLAGSRIYRPPSDKIRAVGVSHKRTLNLTATMGDLLFKIEPAVLNCRPDVEYIKLEDKEYILIACTDGVWDHLKVRDQNNAVTGIAQSILDGNSFLDAMEEQPEPGRCLSKRSDSTDSATTLVNEELEKRVQVIADVLVKREGGRTGLFAEKMIRYDDATACIVRLKPKKCDTEVEGSTWVKVNEE